MSEAAGHQLAEVPSPAPEPVENEPHIDILNRGVEEWNRWRDENPDITPNLEGVKCTHADRRKANLRNANLREADLSNSNFSEADLRNADLRGALLGDTKFKGADLRDADFRDADFSGAELEWFLVEAADLRGADLQGISFSETSVAGTNLDGTQFGGNWDIKVSAPFLMFYHEAHQGGNDFAYLPPSHEFWDYAVKGATHFDFVELAQTAPILKLLGLTGSIDKDRMIDIINEVQLSFFDHYLRGKPIPGELYSNIPEIVVRRQ